MQRRFSAGTRVAVAAAVVVTTTTAVLAVPTSAQAADRHRAESAYDTATSKTATATCSPGDVVIGAGSKIVDGAGDVALTAMVPGPTSVTARGEALAGQNGPWSVVAFAVCRPASGGSPVVVPSSPGSLTSTCPGGTYLSGSGFDLPAGSVLTGLIPTGGMSVTARSRSLSSDSGDPVVYAVCVPELGGFYSARFSASSPFSTVSPKSATVVTDESDGSPVLSGVGAEITFAAGLVVVPVGLFVVFIDSMMPTADLTTVKAEAVARSALVPVPARSTPVPSTADRRAQLGVDETWSITTFATAADYY